MAMHWPATASLDLWPFPVDHAIHIWNQLPNKNTKLAPSDVFIEVLHFGDLKRFHVFGYPVHVLDPVLKDGKRLPMWEKKSWLTIYLELSHIHSSNVALVLNPTITGSTDFPNLPLLASPLSSNSSSDPSSDPSSDLPLASEGGTSPSEGDITATEVATDRNENITATEVAIDRNESHLPPQYHLAYDDYFSTVYFDGTFDTDVWDSLLASNLERHINCPETSDGTPTVPLLSHPEPTLSNVDAELQQMFNKFIPDPVNPSADTDSDTKGSDIPDLPPLASPSTSNTSSNRPSVPEGERDSSSPKGVDSSSPEGDKVETDGNETVPEESKPDRLTFLSPIYFIYNTSNQQSACDQYLENLNPALFTTMANKEENPTHSKALIGSDSVIFTKEIKKEEREELLLLKEESVARYLDLHIDIHSDGSIHLNQTGLIQEILDAMHLNEDSVISVATNCLPINLLGEKAHANFHYTSINGQLKYVEDHLRLDIDPVVSQTSKYVHNSKQSNELALIRIGRCPKRTPDKGIIFRPSTDGTLATNISIDSIFADEWGTKPCTNPDSVESRTGYFIKVPNHPV